MSDPVADSNSERSSGALSTSLSNRMSVEEIARRLDIGRLAVYSLLEQQIIPGITSRPGAGLSCGTLTSNGSAPAACGPALDFETEPEVTV